MFIIELWFHKIQNSFVIWIGIFLHSSFEKLLRVWQLMKPNCFIIHIFSLPFMMYYINGKTPPKKNVSLLIKRMWFLGTLLVLATKVIWLLKPYTAHDLIFILFRLSHDIALALKTLKWSLFDIQHAISESHVHFKNWNQVLESYKGLNKA